MAREEYDREVAARRDAEFEMIRLKEQMRDQAARLGALDEANKQQELLARRSNELRLSVVGIEKELNKMKVERDMTVIEMEEIANLPKIQEDGSSAPGRLSVAINSRLSSIKEEYRSDLELLTAERDSLKLEIEELRQSKEIFRAESASLKKRNMELVDATADAAHQLEALKLEFAQTQLRLLASSAKRDKHVLPHHRSASPSLNSSTGSNIPLIREQIASGVPAYRVYPSTPTPPIDEQPTTFIAQKVETVIPQIAARKFK